MLKTFFRRIIVLFILVLIVCIIGVLSNLKNISTIEEIINISLGSILVFIYFGILPIIISLIITPFCRKKWIISNTTLKRDLIFGIIIVLLFPIFFYLYTINGLHIV